MPNALFFAHRTSQRRASLARRLLLTLLSLSACSVEPAPTPDPLSERTLPSGPVLGKVGNYENHAWLGLPYAKPPLGDLRFRAPRPLPPASALRQALGHGSPCPQLGHPFGVHDADDGEPVGSEDCLYLDVYAPKLSAEQAKTERLPVMVWIHGGGNVVGTGRNYDGGRLAHDENVVVVSVNYRLGPLGWFRHAALREGASAEDASGNYGLLDLIASLRWVQTNIAGFGGDPANVTIFGESAGARDVMALLVAPSSKGLFHRAIAQSGSVRDQPAREAEVFASEGGHKNSASEVLARLLVASGEAKDANAARQLIAQRKPAEIARSLRAATPEALLAAYYLEPDESLPAVPNLIADGSVLPSESQLALFGRSDGHHAVPVMFGTNRDESKTFMLANPKYVKRFTPLYMRMRDPDRYNALAEALSRAWKVAGADAAANAWAGAGGEVYVYRFDWDEEPTLLGADLSQLLGAGHGIEIPFVFGHFDLGRRANMIFTDDNAPGRERLARQMMAYWATFARTGQPGSGSGEDPEWKAFGQPGDQNVMIFDTDAGGGVRLTEGSLDMDKVVAGIESDSRLSDARERCEVLHELVRASPLLRRESYPSLGHASCAQFPYDEYPWQASAQR